MTVAVSGLVNQGEIASAVRKVERNFSPQVVRIGHSYGDDGTGAPAVYFRILVSDEVAHQPQLREVSRRLAIDLMNEARTDENGLRAYFDFRSVSEQQELQYPAWN